MAGTGTIDVKRAARDFDPADHPRDRRGRFIETGAEVDILGGAHGVVLGQGAHGRIQIRLDNGKVVERHRNYLTVTASAPDKPKPAAPARPKPAAPARREPAARSPRPAAAAGPDAGDGLDDDDRAALRAYSAPAPAPTAGATGAAAFEAAEDGERAQIGRGTGANARTYRKLEDGTWSGPDGRLTSAQLADRGAILIETDPEDLAAGRRADRDAANRNPDGTIRRYLLGEGEEALPRTYVDPEEWDDAKAPGPRGTITTDDHGQYSGPLRQIANRTSWPSGSYLAQTPGDGLALVSIDRSGAQGRSRRVRISDPGMHADLTDGELAELRSQALAAIGNSADPRWAPLRDAETPREGATDGGANLRALALAALGAPPPAPDRPTPAPTPTPAPADEGGLATDELAALRRRDRAADTAVTAAPTTGFADLAAWKAHATNPPASVQEMRGGTVAARLADLAASGKVELAPGGRLLIHNQGRGSWQALDAWTGLGFPDGNATTRKDTLAAAAAFTDLDARGDGPGFGTPALAANGAYWRDGDLDLRQALTRARARADREVGKPDSMANHREREDTEARARIADRKAADEARAERLAAGGYVDAEIWELKPGDEVDLVEPRTGARYTGTFGFSQHLKRTSGHANDGYRFDLANFTEHVPTGVRGNHHSRGQLTGTASLFTSMDVQVARRDMTPEARLAGFLDTPTVRRDGGWTSTLPNGITVAFDSSGRQIAVREGLTLMGQDSMIRFGVLDDTGHLSGEARAYLRKFAVDNGENYPGEKEALAEAAAEAAETARVNDAARAAIPNTDTQKLVVWYRRGEYAEEILEEIAAELHRRGRNEDGYARAGGQADLDGAQPPSDALLGQRVFYRERDTPLHSEPGTNLRVGTLRYNALGPGLPATYYLETQENSSGEQRDPLPIPDGDYVAVVTARDPRMARVIADNNDDTEFTTAELNDEIDRVRVELDDLWRRGVRLGRREFDERAARINALGAVVDARDPDEDVAPRQTEELPFDLFDPEPVALPVTTETVRAAKLSAGDRIVVDGAPAEVTSVEVRGERTSLGLLRADGTGEDVDMDSNETVPRIVDTDTGVPTPNPTPDPTPGPSRDPIDTPGPDGGTGGDSSDTDTDVVLGADLRAGMRLDVLGSWAVVLRTRRDGKDTVTARVRFADGTEDSYPFGTTATIDLADPPPAAPVEALPEGAQIARPVLYTYQRRNILALHLDDPDGPAANNPLVVQAAARLRARQPLSAEQATALATVLRFQGRAPGVPPARTRTLERAAAAMDAAAAQARGLAAPTPPSGGTVTKTNAGGITVGDQVGLPNPDGSALLGRVSAVRPMMGGRLVEVTVTGPDGEPTTRLLAARTDAYVLPDLPAPVPVAPTRRGPEHVNDRDLRIGDRIRYPADPRQILTVMAIEPGTRARDNDIVAAFDDPAKGRVTLPGNHRDEVAVANFVRESRGPASTDQPWVNVMPVENPTPITAAQVRLGDRIALGGEASQRYTGYVESLEPETLEGGGAGYRITLRTDYGRADTWLLHDEAGTGDLDHFPVTRLVEGTEDIRARIRAQEADQAQRRDLRQFTYELDKTHTAAYHNVYMAVRHHFGYDMRALTREKVLDFLAGETVINHNRNVASGFGRVIGESLGYGRAGDSPLIEAGRSYSIEVGRRAAASVTAAVIDAAPLPEETEGQMLSRVLQAYSERPPLFDHAAAAATLMRLRDTLREAGGTDPDTGGGATVPKVPDLPADADLKARMAAYRAALPQSMAAFGKNTHQVTTFEPTTLEDLEAGKVPALTTAETYSAADAPDGGPDAAVMARTQILRAAGAELDADFTRRLAEAVPDPDGQRARLTEAREQATTRSRVASLEHDRLRKAALDRLATEAGYASWSALDTEQYRLGYDEAARARRTEIRAQLAAISTGADADAAVAAAKAAATQAGDAARVTFTALRELDNRLAKARREAALATLNQVRPMGGVELTYTDPKSGRPLTGRSELLAAMRFAEGGYPTDWLTAAKARGGIGLSRTTRGNYEQIARRIKLSPDSSDSVFGVKMGRVATHELGHDMERSVPGLLAAERAFLWSRTSTGEVGSRKREKLVGIGNSRKERGYKDEFPEHYSGKDYQRGGDGSAWEVLTTGIESLMAGSPYLDEDFRQWLFGTLALL